MHNYHLYQSVGQPGKVVNPASSGQLIREMEYSPVLVRSRLRIRSHEMGSAVSLLIFHTQAESGAYSRDSSRFPP